MSNITNIENSVNQTMNQFTLENHNGIIAPTSSYKPTIKEEFITYLEKKTPNYPKNKNGAPNMRYKINKNEWFVFITQRCQNRKNKRKEFDVLEKASVIQKKIEPYECVICMETIDKNICVLNCKHSFCVECFGQHMREKGDCPLCRDTVIEKPKKIEEMPPQTMSSIVTTNLMNTGIDQRNNLTMKLYLKQLFNKYYNEEPKEEHIREMMVEISEFGLDVANNIIEWYKM